MSSENSTPDHPFERIALSLSGGGVRAVGYHLGTLDYLRQAGLLPNVRTLSSVSGGSLVAIGYALSLKQEESYQDFHDNICEFLPELNTLEELLKNLESKTPPVASGSRTMITALAQVYRQKYFLRYYNDPSFGIFWEEKPEIPLKEIIFNATEFKTGFAFRFQKSDFDCQCGNGKIWLHDKYARMIRMSDIMAASSCIPGGMEPLLFPQDFHWPGDEWKSRGRSKRPVCAEVEQSLRDNFGTDSVPLMDGGVYDNQGISSVILALARRYRAQSDGAEFEDHDQLAGLEPMRPHNWARWLLTTMECASDEAKHKDMGKLNLFIVSDTPVRKDPMYHAEPVQLSWRTGIKGFFRRMNLGTISNWGWALTVVLLISLGASVFRFLVDVGVGGLVDKLSFNVEDIMFVAFTSLSLLVPALAVAVSITALLVIRSTGKKIAESVVESMPPMRRSLWFYAKKMRLGQLWDMVTLRATSLTALASRIYMNRIRQLGYSLLYSHEEYEKRIMDNDINTLIVKRRGEIPDTIEASAEVQKTIERAATMNTKLWIDKPAGERDDLDVLIAAGQISTCFNVIKYLWQNHRDADGELHESVRPLFDRAEADWCRYNEDPYWMVDGRKEAGRPPGLYWNRPGAYARKRWFLPTRKPRPA